MCPACIVNLALAAAGGGLATFVFSSFYSGNKQLKRKENKDEKNRKQKEEEKF